MDITVLKCKLHKACVTHSELNYDGSCAIDAELMAKANINEYEQIQVYSIDNGVRFTTYAMLAEANSGIISINGAAAHLASPGDRVIICAYTIINQIEISNFKPTLIYLDQANKIVSIKDSIIAQAC